MTEPVKPVRNKRAPRPHGRDRKRPFVTRFAHDLATCEYLYNLGAKLSHLSTERIDDDGEFVNRERGRPPGFPPEAYLIYAAIMGYARCSDRDAEQLLQDPYQWEPIRQELWTRFPEYPRLAPGGIGPSRRDFWRWQDGVASSAPLLNTLLDRFVELACQQALQMGLFDPDRTDFNKPDLRDLFIGDGTVAKAMYDASPGDVQLNLETGELEQIRFDPDASRQIRKSVDDEVEISDTVGTHYGLIHATTGHPNEVLLLDLFHVPQGPGSSEAKVSIRRLERLTHLLPGAKGALWDKAMHGKERDQSYAFGLPIHAKVTLGQGKRPKEALIEMSEVRASGKLVGSLPLVGVGGAGHVRVTVRGEEHHVRLIPTKTLRRRNLGGRGRAWRHMQEYRVPDDPRIPKRFRGGTIRTRLDTTDDDRKRGINRAENLRPVAEGDRLWEIVGGPRARAESLNSKLKHRWVNRRIPAMGVGRQTVRLLGFGIALNWEAQHHYANRLATEEINATKSQDPRAA